MNANAYDAIVIGGGHNGLVAGAYLGRAGARTVAGIGREHHVYAGDGIPARDAPLWQPHGVCVGENGSLVVSDTIRFTTAEL